MLTRIRSVLHFDRHIEGIRSVLHFDRHIEGFAQFTSEDGERAFDFPVADWEDMGNPTVITVSAVPGDRLNED